MLKVIKRCRVWLKIYLNEFLIERRLRINFSIQNNKTSYALTSYLICLSDNQSLISIVFKILKMLVIIDEYYYKFIKSSYDVLISGDFKDSIWLINSYFKGTNERYY